MLNRLFNRERERDWARRIPQERPHLEYEDYGWERGQSVLPEFRDPSVHVMPYERERVSRWREFKDNLTVAAGRNIRGRYTGVGPKGYQPQDEKIFEQACERLTLHGQVDASDIQIQVQGGEVTLLGTVHTRREKRMAEDAIETISGVRDIHNQLKVGSRSGVPGGGQGRVERVGETGVHPASGPLPNTDAEIKDMAPWGQGKRGAKGYQDSGEAELPLHGEDYNPT